MPKPDDLEAVRTIAAALSGFSPEEQERILRWSREKIGLAPATRAFQEERQASSVATQVKPPELAPEPQAASPGKDLKTFVAGKSPRNDIQFAATVAYFYRFEAPPDQRRNEIDAAMLQDACRLAGRARFPHPSMTLNNAKNQGLIDKGAEAGKYEINTVGENLVAMTLPGQADSPSVGKKAQKATKRAGQTARRKSKPA